LGVAAGTLKKKVNQKREGGRGGVKRGGGPINQQQTTVGGRRRDNRKRTKRLGKTKNQREARRIIHPGATRGKFPKKRKKTGEKER